MNRPKLLFFIILVCALRGVGGFAQTVKKAAIPKRYNVLVKYNIELVAMGNIYREREIKTNGVNRSGDEHLQHWGNTQTFFNTQGALIASNFELYKDTETGIISIASTDDTKVSTRKKAGVVGKTTGRHEVMDFDKNVFQEWVSTRNDIAHNEGYNREFVCKKHHTIFGEGDTPVTWQEGEIYSAQMRYNPKNQRVEIRNWLPDFDLNISGTESFSSSGDKNCNNSLNTSQDASELVSQFSLGLGQLLKNSIIYNSKEGMGDQMREIPYVDIQNLGQFAAFRFSNQAINVRAAETENRYIFNMSFKDSFRETPVNITTNPDAGAFYKREFEGKEFRIRASVMIVFQQKYIKFDDYPGEELPSEDPSQRDLGWVPLMDKDDYPPTNKQPKPDIRRVRNIKVLVKKGYTENPSSNQQVYMYGGANGITLLSDTTGECMFTANKITSILDADDSKLVSFQVLNHLMPVRVSGISIYGSDTTLIFREKPHYRNVTVVVKNKDGSSVVGAAILSNNAGSNLHQRVTESNGEALFVGNTVLGTLDVKKWTFQALQKEGYLPLSIEIPTVGADTTLYFTKKSILKPSKNN